MRIMTNTYPWTLAAYKRNRERRVHWEITSLNDPYSDLEFFLVDSLFATVLGNISFSLHALSAKFLRTLPSHYLYHAISLNGPYWYFALQRMNFVPRYLLKEKKIDLFYSHEYFPINFNQDTVPIVYDTRMPTDDCFKAYKSNVPNPDELIEKQLRLKYYCGKRSSLITLTSPGDVERFQNTFPDLANKVRLCPWYVPDLNPIDKSVVMHKHEMVNDRLKVLFVGNDSHRKGLPELVKGLAILTDDERKKIEVTCVTNFHDGPVDTANLDIKVLSGIPYTHVQELMNKSHVFLFPTKGDTYGLVITEAMAAGCMVITSNREPQDWFVNMGQAGLLVEPTDPSSIAQALRYVLNNPEERNLLALAGYERFLSTFHHKVVGKHLRNIFYEAMDNLGNRS